MTFNYEFFIQTFFTAMKGIPVTLKLTAFSLLLSLPIGFLFAVIRLHEKSVVKKLISVYISLIRGTPIVVQILVIYSIVPSIVEVIFNELRISISIFDVNPIIYAYIVFTLNTIALISEVFRSALLTVDKGQLEAAQAAGLTTIQGYYRIVIPQALVTALPNLCNTTTNLIKSTSLAFLMTVKDITAIAKVEAAYGYNYIEAYMVIWVLYIIICVTVEMLFKLLEKRFKTYKTVVAG
jgi:L-cystine transport system permease protein